MNATCVRLAQRAPPLVRSAVRLLTLILALQAALELRDTPSTHSTSSGQAGSWQAFADGVICIPLAPIRDPDLVLATIPSVAARLAASGGTPLLKQLANIRWVARPSREVGIRYREIRICRGWIW